MFEIDDTFLASIGYDVRTLSEERKIRYKNELSEELSQRIKQALVDELDEAQANELSDIEESFDRAQRWLEEFHQDYRERGDFRQLSEGMLEEQVISFYAVGLWLRDAIPRFGEIVQEEFTRYQQELIAMRQQVNATLAG